MRADLGVFLAVASFAGSAQAEAPVFSAGGRAGVHWPLQSVVTPGPLAGAAFDAAIHPNISLGTFAEASTHTVTDRSGRVLGVVRAGGGLYGRYRFDVMRVMPFVEGALLAHQLQVAAFPPAFGFSAAAAFGLNVPLWRHLYADVLVRYGYVIESGRFPAGATVELGLGWRSGSL